MDENHNVIPLVTTDQLLENMGMPELINYFNGIGITSNDIISLELSEVHVLLPSPTYTFKDRCTFVKKYCEFMTSNKLALHESFSSQQEGSKRSTEKEISSFPDADLPIVIDDESADLSDDNEPLQKKANRMRESVQQTATGVPNVDCMTMSAMSKPLVDRSVIGAPRRAAKEAIEAIDDLNLRNHLLEYPSCRAVLCSYISKGVLLDSDRSIVTDTVVEWLLKHIEYPKENHYTKLREKIMELFPTEKDRTWYIPPFSLNDEQKYAKGRLYEKVKNLKMQLRKKGLLTQHKKRDKQEATAQIAQSPDEKAAEMWLMRNQEPFDDVKIYWKRCSISRLKGLLHGSLTPAKYIEKWQGILKMPKASKLVVDDFEVLPDVDPYYECLRGKGNNLLDKWPDFVNCIESIINNDDFSGLSPKEKKRFSSLLKNAPSENVKDYIILQTLPLLCKQKGRVRFGKKIMKPSVEESKDSFILFVPGAGEFDNYLRERQKRHQKAGAQVEPYLLVLGPAKNNVVPEVDSDDSAEDDSVNLNDVSVTAAYVIVNDVPWKIGSVLGAVDTCFKTYFSIHTNYPSEACHLWLVVQKFLYGIELRKDPEYSGVTDFLTKLEYVSK